MADLKRNNQLLVEKPRLVETNSGWELSTTLTIRDIKRKLWYKLSGGRLTDHADVFLSSCLYLAMRLRLPLHIEGDLSPELIRSAGIIQQIAEKWYCTFSTIPLTNTPETSNRICGHDVGCFFSGGVDSFYSLLKHSDHISKIIFVHGFDIPLSNYELRKIVSKELNEVSKEIGKELIEVETNLREISDQYIDWIHYFGSGLASVAQLLSSMFKRIYIPSSETYAHLEPCGSHPLLDPLWSTQHLEIIHDGCEATRIEKVRKIAQYEIALKKLRVCWENKENAYNCGVCEKCIRTMISLSAIGALDNCSAFNSKLDPHIVSQIKIPNDLVLHHIDDNLKALKASPHENAGISKALERCASNYEKQKKLDMFPLLFTVNGKDEKRMDCDLQLRDKLLAEIWGYDKKWVVKKVLKEGIKDIDTKFLKGLLLKTYKKYVKSTSPECFPIDKP
jgi:hypothetical protein